MLQHEFDPKRREKLWEGVRKVVELNSNVRVRMREVQGEPMKCWSWVGGTLVGAGGADGSISGGANGGDVVEEKAPEMKERRSFIGALRGGVKKEKDESEAEPEETQEERERREKREERLREIRRERELRRGF